MFLQGGGLNQLAVPGAGQSQPGAGNGGGFGLFAPPSAANAVQPTAIGAAAPPMGAGPTFRIASFNIEVFGKTKADKPYVMHTLAEIVRQFHVVAIQEIRTQDDYLMRSFVNLVNSGGRRYDFVVGPRLGNSTSKEQYAFIFD